MAAKCCFRSIYFVYQFFDGRYVTITSLTPLMMVQDAPITSFTPLKMVQDTPVTSLTPPKMVDDAPITSLTPLR